MKDPSCRWALGVLLGLYGQLRIAGLKPDAAHIETVKAFDQIREHVERRHRESDPEGKRSRGAYPSPSRP